MPTMATGIPNTIDDDRRRRLVHPSRDTVRAMLKQATVLSLLVASAALRRLPDDALIDDGSRKLQAGDANGAIDAFEHARREGAQGSAPALPARRSALQKKGDAAGAEEALREALALDPKLAEVRNELGALLIERRRYAEADRGAQARRWPSKPDLAEAWYNLGQACGAQKECADAHRRLHARHPAAAARRRRLHQPVGGGAQVRQAARGAAAARAGGEDGAAQRAPAHLNLGIALDAIGQARRRGGRADAWPRASSPTTRPRGGASAWSRASARSTTRPSPRSTRRARCRRPPARIADLGVAWRDKGDLARATALFREALAKEPRYTPARWHLAQTLAAQHKCGEMEKSWRRCRPARQGSAGAKTASGM